jgi:hypothetical protein
LALASGHGRYITVIPERALVSVGEWPLDVTVINFLSFHFRNGFVTAGFASETAVRRFQKRNRHLDPEVLFKIRLGF